MHDFFCFRFLIEPGNDRSLRMASTLSNIGPAVLNGGLTTFFAFILLANSQSHVFITFFKVFFLVVSFGLYHGLIVLPVILSLFGPDSNPTPKSSQENEIETPLGRTKEENEDATEDEKCQLKPVTS